MLWYPSTCYIAVAEELLVKLARIQQRRRAARFNEHLQLVISSVTMLQVESVEF